MIARDYIGQHLFVSVADMRWRIRVIDRRGEEERLRHFLCSSVAAVYDCRKLRRPETAADVRGQALRLAG